MRGKTKIWTLALLSLIFGASLMLSSPSVKAAPPDNTVSLDQPIYGPHNPGDTFTIEVLAGYVENVRAIEFRLRWDQTVLKILGPDEPPALGKLLEGPFLASGGKTDPVARKGLAGNWVSFSNILTTYSWVDGSSDDYGPIAVMTFLVIGGGKTNLELSGRLYDPSFNPIPGIEWVGGYFWSPFPHVGFTWWVKTAEELPPAHDLITTNGTSYIVVTDPDGDTDYLDGPSYLANRPALTLDDATGAPESVKLVEGGTMYYGDEIIFDASASYDLDNMGNPATLDPTAFKWVIRNGGEDKFKWGGKWYDCRYESGVELPSQDKFSYVFPGSGPPGPGCDYDVSRNYAIYSRLLGFHLLALTVTDSNGNIASYFTWIRIYRLSPAKTVNLVVPDPKHELSKDGYTKTFKGNVQNRGGTSWFIWDSLSAYLSLARMIHAYMWIRIQFDIYRDLKKPPVATVYSDAVWLGPTETPEPSDVLTATWTIPTNIAHGTYFVKARGYFCGSGVTYGMAATGTLMDSFEILP